jgi:hypothetical protein
MELLQVLVQLLQLGGIGASLAFLYLGYRLLENEQKLRDNANNPASARPEVLAGIRSFLMFSLLFFVIGVLAYAGLYLLERSYPRDDFTQISLSDFELDQASRIFKYAFSETRSADLQLVRNDKRSDYKIYLALRAQVPNQFLDGEFVSLLGPFQFGTLQQRVAMLTPEQVSLLGTGCVEYFLFGYVGGEQLVMSSESKSFKPGPHRDKIKVLDSRFSCP